MHLRTTFALAAASLVVLAGLQPATGAPLPLRDDPRAAAATRLEEDATGALRVSAGDHGAVRFVGAGTGEIVNPQVSRDTGVAAAARSHLTRYGAVLGAGADTAFGAVGEPLGSPAGGHVAQFQQRVGGLPVVAGTVAVSMAADGQLRSMLGSVSRATAVPPAVLDVDEAAAAVRRGAARRDVPADADVTSAGRWLWDPAVVGMSGVGARGVWRFEVSDGEDYRHLVLVDDRTGTVLFDADQVEHALDRVVCDRKNVPGSSTACTSGFARVEGQAATGQADVDAAYRFAGRVSALYQDVAGLDLTQLLGITVGGQKKLASTVRFCYTTGSCPYDNAFWNGTQMFYGEGYATADDVVGHEMTHGVTDHSSSLFYWGQSGAINESMSDVMGEILDHRYGTDDDSAWRLAEDLPIGAIRDMNNPPAFGDPDRTGSPLWSTSYYDNGGVHYNSGVGNKTAYLISQGGTFNGQTITGIDGTDPKLTKTALLYYDAIVSLVSGSEYADLADVLEQGCANLAAVGVAGFTAADCANVHAAVTATELRTTPVDAPQPPDAEKVCPTGTLRELFNSETGTPAASFVGDGSGTWAYGVDPYWGSNARSGSTSWYGEGVDGSPAASSITMANAVSLPAGQPSFLWFNHWRLFEWYGPTSSDPNTYETDGGTVEVDDVGDAAPAQDASALPWVNGPTQVLDPYPGDVNQWAGLHAFAADSYGWIASRADLSAYAGKNVKLQFTSRGDGTVADIGWWLDDISVYTCDLPPAPPPPAQPSSVTGAKAVGRLGKAVVRWAAPVSNPATVTGYRIQGGGTSVVVPASARRHVVTGLRAGRTYRFSVTALGSGGFAATPVPAKARGTDVTLKVSARGGRTVLKGQLLRGHRGLRGKPLKVLAKKGSHWVKVDTMRTVRKGRYVVRVHNLSERPYRVAFKGGAGLMGSRSPKRHLG